VFYFDYRMAVHISVVPHPEVWIEAYQRSPKTEYHKFRALYILLLE